MKSSKMSWRHVSLAALVCLSACTSNDIDPTATGNSTPSNGTADFTKYVAVGNSLTAGFADAGLYRESQLNSYPNMLAGQFRQVGGGNFVQPLFTEAQANGSGYLRLIKLPGGAAGLPTFDTTKTQLAVRGLSSTGGPLYTKFTEANQNLGVPGIRVADLLTAGYGSTQGNPYFERLTITPTTTYFQYASDNLNGATFYTCWLGNNDALQYAITGGIVDLTPIELFRTNFTAMMNKLAEGGRKGVVIGIPNITTAPYFTTATTQINALLRAQGISGLAIRSRSAPGGIRLSGAGDYFLLSLAPVLNRFIAQGIGLSAANPIPDQYVLDASEVTALNARIGEFNTVMKTQADAKGAAYLDSNGILSQLTSAAGLVQDGITYSSSYIQGGIYSLDGLHLTPAGYAFMANEIIKATNAKYGSTVPTVNVANYRRVLLQS